MTRIATLRSVAQSQLERFLVDRAVIYFGLTRLWPVVAGPVTALMITAFLTPTEQGFYYAFWALLGARTFFELSFSTALVPFVAHEWAGLSMDADGRIQGDAVARDRLGSLARIATFWYGGASLAFAAVIAVAGAAFLGNEGSDVAWRSPWFLLIVLSGAHLFLVGPTTFLEGCHQVAPVYFARLVGLAAGSVGVWVVLAAGGGVWAACAATGIAVLADLALVVTYRRFFRSAWRATGGRGIAWRREFLPMQWRMAVGGVVVYFAFYLFVPVVFHYHGAEAAGRIGMTWQIVSAVGGVAQAWLNPRIPQFASLVAVRAYDELDALFLRVAGLAVGFAAFGGVSLVVLAVILDVAGAAIADRVLEPQWIALLMLATVLMQVTQAQAGYLRAHRREPLMPLNVVASLLIGLAVWLLGARFGAPGAVVAYLLVVALVILPGGSLIWVRFRRGDR